VLSDDAAQKMKMKAHAMEIVTADGHELALLEPNLRNDVDIVRAAVSQNGCALAYASSNLCNDKETVILAINNSFGNALYFASSKLRNDLDMVRSAVRIDGNNICYASNSLKQHHEVLIYAIAQNPRSVKHVSRAAVEGIRPFITERSQLHCCFMTFLRATLQKPRDSTETTDVARRKIRTTLGEMLNRTGKYFAIEIKRLVAMYVGVPLGEYLRAIEKTNESIKTLPNEDFW
jgi:hypothetical protein